MMNLLVLGAHLDDSVLAVGGIIRKVVNAGGEVNVVCFGNSDEDFADVADKDTAAARITAQARRAHDVLGANSFTCFNYSDYAVQESRETYRLCIESIRRYRPDVILSHYWAEYFQHHAMARLACDSWWQAGWSCSADLGPPWMASSLYHFEVIQLLPNPTDIVDISETFAVKMEAWRCFQSSSEFVETDGETAERRAYGATLGGSLTEQLETRARYYGSLIGARYGEALKKSDYLPRVVRDINLL
ncbi:MAG: PIG-L family deacetylase [Bryobacteraceae bacterium]|nr:PIG-L family deacetylase [Bryobacteraceae bacterium]